MSRTLSRRALVVGGGLIGLVLFAATLRAVSPSAVLAGVRRVGEGFAWLVLLGGVRLAARAGAWSACAGGPSRLPFGPAFRACIAGEAAGNLTPLGLAASEPLKVVWVRDRVNTIESAASLAAETLVYSLAVAVMLVLGGVAWMAAVAPAVAAPAVVIAVGPVGAFAITWVALQRRGRRGGGLLPWLETRAEGRPVLGAVTDGLRRTREILRSLLARPTTLAWVTVLQVVFQAAAVGEVWLTLFLLGFGDVTFLQAFLLEFANRVVTVAFKFVPMRLGVDEAASGAMASLLGSGVAVGVTLAVIRKARVLCWSAVGLTLIGGRAVAARGRPRTTAVLLEADRHMTS